MRGWVKKVKGLRSTNWHIEYLKLKEFEKIAEAVSLH